MVRLFVVAFVLSCLAASAAAQSPEMPATGMIEPAPRKLPPKNEARDNRPGPAGSGHCQLGIIPIAGDDFSVQEIGFGAISNQYARIKVVNWGFDDLVAERVRAAAHGQEVRRIVFGRKELARHKIGESLFPDVDTDLDEFVRDVSAGTDCEHYVVVQLRSSRIMKTSGFVYGMGIVNVGTPIARHNFLFALTYIRVYDGRSFEIVSQGATSTDDQSPASQAWRYMPFEGPKLELDDAAFPADPTGAAANATFRRGVRALLKASLDSTLPAMLRSRKGVSR
jgi:hypothetical protein